MKKCAFTMFLIMFITFLLSSCDNKGKQPNTSIPETQVPVSITTSTESTISVTTTTQTSLNSSNDIKDELLGLWKRIDGSTTTIPLTAALYDHLGKASGPPVHNTTSKAYDNLISKRSDLIFVTYPSENEFNMAKQAGVELEVIPVVKDALVFLVNIENSLDNISLSELRDIYTGKITNWETLGGSNEDIIPYQRTADSGSQTLLLKLVMDGQEPMSPPVEWVAKEMGYLVELVSNYDNSRDSIGYSMYYYVNNMYGNSRFKLLSVDGINPTQDTIARGEYPLGDYYYAVIRKDTPLDSPARKLIDWLLTDDGQALAVKAGYTPLHPMENVSSENTIDSIYLGDTESSSGTGGTTLKSWDGRTELVTNGVRKPLSDVFFDGFNYIQYINDEIESQILISTEGSGPIKTQLSEEDVSTRPFSGIPKDYPNYALEIPGYLTIYFSAGNPFFAGAKSFDIRLAEDISPYGVGLYSFTTTYHYARQILPNIDLFSMSIKLQNKPDIEKRINEQLKAWTDGFPNDNTTIELLGEFANWILGTPEQPYKLNPVYGQWGNYLTVSYIPQMYGGVASPDIQMPMLYTICFDMTSGDVVNFADVLPRKLSELPFEKAFIKMTPILHFEGTIIDNSYPAQGHSVVDVPKDGSVISEAWLYGDTLCLYITEPDGRKLQIAFIDVVNNILN